MNTTCRIALPTLFVSVPSTRRIDLRKSEGVDSIVVL
jgi:hypothetical protein